MPFRQGGIALHLSKLRFKHWYVSANSLVYGRIARLCHSEYGRPHLGRLCDTAHTVHLHGANIGAERQTRMLCV